MLKPKSTEHTHAQPFDHFQCNFIAQSICTTMYVHMRCIYVVVVGGGITRHLKWVQCAQMHLNYIKSRTVSGARI